MNQFLHAHAHTICAHSEGTSIHTPACASTLCCKDLYDKVADRQWQGCDPACLAADADRVIAPTVHVCECAREQVLPTFMQNQLDIIEKRRTTSHCVNHHTLVFSFKILTYTFCTALSVALSDSYLCSPHPSWWVLLLARPHRETEKALSSLGSRSSDYLSCRRYRLGCKLPSIHLHFIPLYFQTGVACCLGMIFFTHSIVEEWTRAVNICPCTLQTQPSNACIS